MMAEAGEPTDPERVTTVHLYVDRYIWKYMNKSAKYRAKVKDIGRECETHIQDADADVESGDGKTHIQVSQTGGSETTRHGCTSQLLQLVDECRQTVSTYTLDGQDVDTCNSIVENASVLDDPASALVDVDSAAGLMRLTGTKEEINYGLGLLEVLGVPLPSDLATQTAVPVDEAPPPSLQLWKEEGDDKEEDYIYAPAVSSSPATVTVDAKLWKYLQKSNGQWVAEITEVREKMGVVMTESLTDDGAVSLTLAGLDDDVEEATDRVRDLVDRCRDVAQTVDVVCPDSTVRAKVLKFLPQVNKLPAYVAVESDDRMTVTGTSKELDECAVKLSKLGASLARADCDADEGGLTTAISDEEPVPHNPWPDFGGASGSAVRQDLAEDERIARQLQQEEENAQRPQHFVPTRVLGPSDDGGQEGRQFGEIPVPIEHELWSFVEKRRAQQLQQLREVYRVKISTYPAVQDGFVMITIEAESALMLEYAQDELVQLLEMLRGSVVVVHFGDEGVERGQQLPPQVGQLFSQLAEGTDAVIEVRNNQISITGPEKAVAECQQKLAALVQQAQQGQGMGGGAGRGMRLGGGGLDLSAGMGDSEMARYMRTQRMQMPGYRGASDDMMRAVMMDGGGRGGGPGEDGGFFSMSAGAGSFAPFARHPQNALGMSRGPERMGGGLWQSEQLQPGALESLGVGSPMRQGMFDTGVRDRGADLKPFDGRGDEDLMFLPARPPIEQLPQPQPQDTSVKKSADENRDNGESKPRVVRFADEEPARQPSPKPPPVPSTSAKTCSVCQHTEQGEASKPCQHAFCVSCVQQYFIDGQRRCPVCGIVDDGAQQQPGAATQPDDGVMMVTYDNAFRLPGYETTSRGTIVVCYSFPPGLQKDFQPNPGRKYSGVSKTAFFPLTTEGSNVVDLLQKAFDNRQVFAMSPSSDGSSEEITWNGIDHKTNIYGGPKKYGYPDPIYIKRVQHVLHNKGFH